MEIFSFIFFLSPTILYSIVSETTKVLGEYGELDEDKINWGEVEVDFFNINIIFRSGSLSFLFFELVV